MRKVISLWLALTLTITLLAACMPNPEPDLSDVDDGLEYLTRKYGLSEAQVFELADELGVPHEEISDPENFDPEYPFPINHYKKLFEEFEKEYGRKPLSSEVDQIVKGFVGECWINAVSTEYLFYSTQVNRTWFWKERVAGVIMVVSYTFEPGQHYERAESVYKEVYLRDIALDWADPYGNPLYPGCIKNTKEYSIRATATTQARATATAEALATATIPATIEATATLTTTTGLTETSE